MMKLRASDCTAGKVEIKYFNKGRSRKITGNLDGRKGRYTRGRMLSYKGNLSDVVHIRKA